MPTLAYLCVLPILISLGIWQLSRAEQKQLFFKTQEQQLQSDTLDLKPDTQINTESAKYNKIRVDGHYDVAHQFLLDNQINTGKVGYFVLTPLMLEGSGKAVLINRGWVPLQSRTILPNVAVTDAPITVSGRINHFLEVGMRLPGAEIPAQGWPSVVQVVDGDVLSKALGYPLFQFQIELDASQANGYKRDWHTTTLMRPEQHTAYAVQWFALALILTILFIRYSLKKADD
jgi:surfeit locus 1 family protein